MANVSWLWSNSRRNGANLEKGEIFWMNNEHFRVSVTVELLGYKRNIFMGHFFFSRRFNLQYYYSVCDCYGRFLCCMPRYHCLPEVKASSKTKGASTTGSRQRDIHLDAMFLLPNALCLWLHFWNLIKNAQAWFQNAKSANLQGRVSKPHSLSLFMYLAVLYFFCFFFKSTFYA